MWRRWQNYRPEGGFDAVIGNPPWDRIKLQEVEWFATRDPDLARAPTAAARRAGIKRLREQVDPLAHAFDQAKARADRLGQVIRASGHYPLLGGGDINLYSLFVERSLRLVKPNGLVGLLTPSGIYADRTAARFFQSVSTTGRVAGIYDFENRKIFFKDIHASFKFCPLIVGGSQRTFPETRCGFFLPGTDAITDPDRAFTLTPDDFARVNPNTGTAPVFRTRRDADLTRRIYRDHPVLVDRSDGREDKLWPVRYRQGLFHSQGASSLFRTATQLDAAGAYPVAGNRWKKGEEIYVPLYEGKMVQAFDHRAASIATRKNNLFRPGQPVRTSEANYRDPGFSPSPRFWINKSEHTATQELQYILAFKEITASTNVCTMIASVVPQVGCTDTLPVLLPNEGKLEALDIALILGNLNSFAFDFVARQKIPATHIKLYMLEQLHSLLQAPTTADLATAPPPTSSAITSSASPTPPTTWPPSPATSATTTHPSRGTPNNAATSEPASTPSTSTSTTSPATTPPTSSPPSPSLSGKIRLNSGATTPETLSLPT